MHPNVFLLFLLVAFGSMNPCVLASHMDDALKPVGILYEVWHTTSAQLMEKVQALGGQQLTTELVLQSNGKLTLDDVYKRYGLSGGNIWNVKPQIGFYCLYRHRVNDTSPPIPDCKNITATAKAHAQMLLAAGVDYVAVDITNWPTVNEVTDIAVLRPTEVLFEEWLSLRKQGINTPQIAVWPCSPRGGDTWSALLNDIYNNPAYADLIYSRNGKKVVFLPDNPSCYDASVEQDIRSNGGRNDVVTIKMWALFGPQLYKQGTWGFFSPCTDSSGGYTTSVVGMDQPCNQYATLNATTGRVDEISASGAYMVSQSALPFANPGHLRGLTLQRLFQAVLEKQPPALFLSSFNEHIGGRQAPATGANIGFNMGLPNDTQRRSVWVDTYAAEFSRDIEPTVEEGGRVMEVASSCIHLYKRGQTCADQPESPCCSVEDKQVFANVWSLTYPDTGDYLLTNNPKERSILVSEGWKENCNAIGGPSAFCVDTSLVDGRCGPFIIYSKQVASPFQTVPLYRCLNTHTAKHFFSLQSDCEGQKMEFILGYLSTRRGRETLRALYRCNATTLGPNKHSLDLNCNDPSAQMLMGYVR